LAVGGQRSAVVVVDDLIPQSPNLVAGANQAGYHLRNVNYGRDYTAAVVADIAAAGEGDACAECGAPLRAVRGVEVGNIFKLGTFYSEKMGCTFIDRDGQSKPVVMGSYGIGVGRLLACVAEAHHDEFGLVWPAAVAPYHVHMVVLPGKGAGEEVVDTANRLYREFWAAGVETLLDDRAESPGVKFNDADLIGLPIRITVGERGLKQGAVEFKRRDRAEKEMIPLGEALGRARGEVNSDQ
jgi:prolyl-tRNA synthetase